MKREVGRDPRSDNNDHYYSSSRLAGRRGEEQDDSDAYRLYGQFGRVRLNAFARRNPQVRSFIHALNALTSSLSWAVKGEEGDERVDFLKEAIIKNVYPSLPEIASTALESLAVFGWCAFEPIWEIRDNKYMLGTLGHRECLSLSTWTYEGGLTPADRRVSGMKQYNNPNVIPLEKLVILSTDGNMPEGKSLLESSYADYRRLAITKKLLEIGVERDLAGLPIMYVPAELFHPGREKELNEYKELVASVRRNEREGLILPRETGDSSTDPESKSIEFTLLNAGGRRQIDVVGVLEHYRLEILSPLLADFLLLGQKGSASLALASERLKLFYASIDGLLAKLVNGLNRQTARRLLIANGMDEKNPPEIVVESVTRLATKGGMLSSAQANEKAVDKDNNLDPDEKDKESKDSNLYRDVDEE